MTYNGARGTTKQAMADALGVRGLSLQEINEANKALRIGMEALDPRVELESANSLWAHEGIEFEADFIRRNEEFYRAKVTSLNLGAPEALSTINGWVNEATAGKIDDLVGPGDLIQAILLLLNAIYFKGMWHRQFDKEATSEGTFSLPDGGRKTTLMMHQSGRYRYFENRQFQAASLPYGDGRVSMYLFLPNKKTSLTEFQKNLNWESWNVWMSQFREVEGDISVPRFKVEYEAELKEALEALGMGIAFRSGANFEGMCAGPLQISVVRHKSYMEVNEEGTEASAATAVSMARGFPPERFSMIVDRPFFCAIRDDQTGLNLFTGVLLDPK